MTEQGGKNQFNRPVSAREIVAVLLQFLLPAIFFVGAIVIPGGKELVRAVGSPFIFFLVLLLLFFLGRLIGNRLWRAGKSHRDEGSQD